MTVPLAITRCALLTPLDAPCTQGDIGEWGGTWEALRAGQRVSQKRHVDPSILAGDPSLDRSIRMATAVVTRLLAPNEDLSQTALFCGTSKGPVSTLLAALDLQRNGKPLTEPHAWQVAMGVGAMAAALARDFHIPGPVHTSVAACASGVHALHRAAQALQRDECQRALVVAADASLHPLFEASFARLGVLAPADADGHHRCEPFSPEGRGFFLTEAAAALLIEKINPNPSRTSAAVPLAWLDRTWIGGDGTALLAIDAQTQALRRGLALSAPDGTPPAFVHAHATGTEHDRYEWEAIRATFGDHLPMARIFSHKGHLGHSLGAAGLVGVALSVLCHRHGRTWTGTPVPKNTTSLTIAQGFGGHIGLVRLRGAGT